MHVRLKKNKKNPKKQKKPKTKKQKLKMCTRTRARTPLLQINHDHGTVHYFTFCYKDAVSSACAPAAFASSSRRCLAVQSLVMAAVLTGVKSGRSPGRR